MHSGVLKVRFGALLPHSTTQDNSSTFFKCISFSLMNVSHAGSDHPHKIDYYILMIASLLNQIEFGLYPEIHQLIHIYIHLELHP